MSLLMASIGLSLVAKQRRQLPRHLISAGKRLTVARCLSAEDDVPDTSEQITGPIVQSLIMPYNIDQRLCCAFTRLRNI